MPVIFRDEKSLDPYRPVIFRNKKNIGSVPARHFSE
jgi:hypothetical protein